MYGGKKNIFFKANFDNVQQENLVIFLNISQGHNTYYFQTRSTFVSTRFGI